MSHSINNIVSKLTIKDLSNCAVVYARCSTAKQNQDMHQSLQTQLGICIAYANLNNFKIIDTIQEVVRGHSFDKQSYRTITDKYSNTNIIIADASRLSRNIGDANRFMIDCENNNITIHSVREDIITNSTQDKRRLINSVFDASIESRTIAQRVRSAFRIRKQMGSHFGNAPYGYKIFNHIDKQSGIRLRKLIEDPKEQLIIQFINKLYYGGTSSDIYRIFKKIKPNTYFILETIKGEELTTVSYGNINIRDIVILLNENMIEQRDEIWTYSDVSSIVRKNNNIDA